jgi:hypothetical protein
LIITLLLIGGERRFEPIFPLLAESLSSNCGCLYRSVEIINAAKHRRVEQRPP